jgi:hypothetical protein
MLLLQQSLIRVVSILLQQYTMIKCRNCSYKFDPLKEGNPKKRKCGMCSFGDSYYIRSKKEYERNLLFVMIVSQQQY